MTDPSNGYEAVAPIYLAGRGSKGTIGVAQVRQWAQALPVGAHVLDLGCGSGVPISQVLFERGLAVYGLDASASMIAAFRARFPGAPAECNTIEDSTFFNRRFDAVVSWGLMFLLPPASQALLIHKAASVLVSGGRLLFTSPEEVCEWLDGMTDLPSISLGAARYEALLQTEGLVITGHMRDEGDNYYYLANKP